MSGQFVQRREVEFDKSGPALRGDEVPSAPVDHVLTRDPAAQQDGERGRGSLADGGVNDLTVAAMSCHSLCIANSYVNVKAHCYVLFATRTP